MIGRMGQVEWGEGRGEGKEAQEEERGWERKTREMRKQGVHRRGLGREYKSG